MPLLAESFPKETRRR